MSRFTASRLAAIDAAAVEDALPGNGAHPVDADTLRVMAGQANAMLDRPSVIYNVACNLAVDPDDGFRSMSIQAGEDPKLFRFIRGPRRPHWRTAEARFVCIVNTGSDLRVGYRTTEPGEPQWSVWTTGTGSLQTITQTISLPYGLSEQTIEVYVQSRFSTTLADAATIGGANSVALDSTGNPQVRVSRGGAEVGGVNYNLDVMRSGVYGVAWVDALGNTRWTKKIDDASPAGWLDSGGGQGTILSFESPRLGATITGQTNREGGTLEIREFSAWFDFAALLIVGGIP